MGGAAVEVQVIDLLELGDAPQRVVAEGGLAVEGVEDNALEQIAEGHVVVLGQRLQDLEAAVFRGFSLAMGSPLFLPMYQRNRLGSPRRAQLGAAIDANRSPGFERDDRGAEESCSSSSSTFKTTWTIVSNSSESRHGMIRTPSRAR